MNATDQLAWVGAMNCIRSAVEETVLNELICDGAVPKKSQQAQMRLLAEEAWNNSWNLVFTNELGGHLCHCTVYKKFKAIVRELGMPEERFHDLRHSFAVASIESGDDIKTVQSNLGHATASFTLDVYGHVSQKMRQ